MKDPLKPQQVDIESESSTLSSSDSDDTSEEDEESTSEEQARERDQPNGSIVSATDFAVTCSILECA